MPGLATGLGGNLAAMLLYALNDVAARVHRRLADGRRLVLDLLRCARRGSCVGREGPSWPTEPADSTEVGVCPL